MGGEHASQYSRSAGSSLFVVSEAREEGVVEPAHADELGLTGDALEAEAQARDDAQAREVVGGGRAADAVHGHAGERELDASPRGFGHQAFAGGFAAQPV